MRRTPPVAENENASDAALGAALVGDDGRTGALTACHCVWCGVVREQGRARVDR